MASTSLDDLTPDTKRVAEQLIAMAKARGIELRVASTFRTCDEQNAIYAQGRSTPGTITTGAPGCRSWHTWGRAIDVFIRDGGKDVPTSDHRYDELGDIGKSLGMIWGGNFARGRDAVHFEYHPGMTIDDVCPDKLPEACNTQIAKHNASYNPPVDPAVAPISYGEPNQDGFGLGHVVISAIIGAVVFQAVSFGIRAAVKRK